jgi:hypothetical protein
MIWGREFRFLVQIGILGAGWRRVLDLCRSAAGSLKEEEGNWVEKDGMFPHGLGL